MCLRVCMCITVSRVVMVQECVYNDVAKCVD